MIGFGIIGTGAVASHHIKSIQELKGCALIGMSSADPERAKAAAKKFQIPTFSNHLDLIQHHEVQVVCICTASGNHLEPSLAAAAAGKHILVEKPLEVSLERADQMIEACVKAKVQLGCIFQNRFSPDYLRLKQALSEGQLGKLLLGNAYIKWYRPESYYSSSSWKGTLKGDGGAALINQGIHTIDLLLDLMGPVKSVFGKVRTVLHNIEGEDLGIGILQFENGALGTIEGSTSIYPGYPQRLEIYGEHGSIILEGGQIIAYNLKSGNSPELTAPPSDSSGAADPNAIGHQLHKAQIKDFIEAIQDNRAPIVDGKTGRKSLELILKLYESSKTGKELFL